MSAPRHPGRRHTSKCSSICIREPKWAKSQIPYFNNIKIQFFCQLWRCDSVRHGIQMAPGKHACSYSTDLSFIALKVWKWVVFCEWKLSSSKCSADFLFSVPSNICHCSGLAWLWSRETTACASMVCHRDYDGHRPFSAPLASFYLHMLETAGPVRPSMSRSSERC